MTGTVLVVEDEADILLMLRISLQTAGHRVIAAATGEEALGVFDRESPDAMVLDILLPGIDGWQVLEELRKSGRAPKLPVIVVSAYAKVDVARRVKEFGCRGYFIKPFSAEDLCRAVDDILRQASKEPQAER